MIFIKFKRKHDGDNDEEDECVGETTEEKCSSKIKKVQKTKKIKINSKKKDNLIPSLEGCTGFNVEPNKSTSLISSNINDLVAWDIIPLAEVILKALAEQNFTCPTQIQMLTLPAAILGNFM